MKSLKWMLENAWLATATGLFIAWIGYMIGFTLVIGFGIGMVFCSWTTYFDFKFGGDVK